MAVHETCNGTNGTNGANGHHARDMIQTDAAPQTQINLAGKVIASKFSVTGLAGDCC